MVLIIHYYYRPQGKVMFSQASVILPTISLMATGLVLVLSTVWSVRILLECFLMLLMPLYCQFRDIFHDNVLHWVYIIF